MAKYDSRDPDRRVLKLTRAGHHLWALRRQKGVHPLEEQAIDAALETIWQAKRELKVEIEAERIEESRGIRQRFAARKKLTPSA
jgi:phage gp46-like protein